MGVRRREGDEPWWGFVLLWRMQPAPQAALGKKNMAVPLPGRFAGAFLPVPASLEAGSATGGRIAGYKYEALFGEGGKKIQYGGKVFLLVKRPFLLLFPPVSGERWLDKGISLGLAGRDFPHFPW